jgi:tetratricopeptide (TPR) repeat protein
LGLFSVFENRPFFFSPQDFAVIFWGDVMGVGSRLLLCLASVVVLLVPGQVHAQAIQLGKIIANIRADRGDFLSHRVLVSLEMRGSVVATAYSEDGGRVGFYNLVPNEYRVTVNDEAYEPFNVRVEVDPTKAPMNFVQITLVTRRGAKKDSLPARVGGSNPYLIDPAEYNRQFPKKTLKEFDKGVAAEHRGKTDEAIAHYQKALNYSPNYYPAHNNLGGAYLGRQKFAEAQEQFEAALKANQNDVEAYFNLANVLLLTQHYPDAEHELDEGLKRMPDSAFGHFLQGLLYSRTARPELAEKSLQSALQLDPKMSQVYLQLVNLYVQQRRIPEAIHELESYLKVFPDAPFSPQARDLLKRLQGETSASKIPR